VNTLGSMLHFHGSRTSTTKSVLTTRSAYRNPRGSLWWVGAAGPQSVVSLFLLEHGRMSGYPLPKGSFVPGYSSAAVYVAEDRTGVLWVVIEGHGLFGLKGGIWKQFDTPPWLTELTPTAAYTDWMGRVWFGYSEGPLSLWLGLRYNEFLPTRTPRLGA
jgi:hypothetical protein